MPNYFSFGGSYPYKVGNIVEEGQALTSQFPSDEVGDVLAVRSCPPEAKGQANISEESALKLKTDYGPDGWVKGKLPLGLGHVC